MITLTGMDPTPTPTPLDMTTGGGGASQWPQLRGCCDGCNAAKVKCSRGRPTCARCEARGTRCVYSVSLRSVRRKPHTQTQAQAQAQAQAQNPMPNSQRGAAAAATGAAGGGGVGAGAGAASQASPRPDPTQGSVPISVPTAPATPAASTTSSSSTFGHGPALLDPDGHVDLSVHDPLLLDGDWDYDLAGLTLPDLTAMSTMSSCPSPSAPPSAHANPAITTTTTTTTTTTCSCHSAVTAKLSRLAGAPQPMADLPLDSFLASTKDVVATSTRVLDCTNAHDHDRVLLPVLLATLLLHLVCIYDCKIASLAGRGPHAPSLPVRLSLGSYQLEGSDAQAVHASLIQMDLSKIRALLDAFDERFCGPSVVDPSAHAVASLIAYVKRRLRASLDAVRAWPLHHD